MRAFEQNDDRQNVKITCSKHTNSGPKNVKVTFFKKYGDRTPDENTAPKQKRRCQTTCFKKMAIKHMLKTRFHRSTVIEKFVKNMFSTKNMKRETCEKQCFQTRTRQPKICKTTFSKQNGNPKNVKPCFLEKNGNPKKCKTMFLKKKNDNRKKHEKSYFF